MTVRRALVVSRHEGPDVSWEMARGPARQELAGFVTSICGYSERAAVPFRRREVPDGTVTLILSYGDPVDVMELSHSPAPAPGKVMSFVAGVHRGHALVGNDGHQQGVQVDLTPLAAYRLLGLPMSEIADQVVPLDALRGPAVPELAEQLAHADSWADRVDLVERALLDWAADGPDPDPAVAWAWNQMARSHGGVAVGLLADEIGWSRRHFTNRFRSQVGLPPKPAGRILRFNRANDLLAERRPGSSLTDIAIACGYADHSHMSRDFRELAGCSPSALFDALLPDAGGVAA